MTRSKSLSRAAFEKLEEVEFFVTYPLKVKLLHHA